MHRSMNVNNTNHITNENFSDRRFTVAPMMEWSDRHCRYLWRLLSKHAFMYTEMVTTGALIHGKHHERFLDFNTEEHPIALQLGGCNPADLATCSKMAAKWGYDEVNINVGCPSDRVQSGMIGAILMNHKEIVADSVKAMQDACDLDITVKHRIGVDNNDSWEYLHDFVDHVAQAGCKTFVVHARKAILKGLSPKENREIPPLNYDRVYKLKQTFPDLEFVINGGLKTIEQCQTQLEQLDGVMIGREAYQNPYFLAQVDEQLFNDKWDVPSPHELVEQYMQYIVKMEKEGVAMKHMAKHLMGIFQGVPGARLFRRHLSENMHQQGAGVDVVKQALSLVSI
jgi:tRNA-dihydrouridine synthase A